MSAPAYVPRHNPFGWTDAQEELAMALCRCLELASSSRGWQLRSPGHRALFDECAAAAAEAGIQRAALWDRVVRVAGVRPAGVDAGLMTRIEAVARVAEVMLP